MQSLLYFLLSAGLFFVMMRFGCGAHVMGHGHVYDHGAASRASCITAYAFQEGFVDGPGRAVIPR
jgi:hypothetical protein